MLDMATRENIVSVYQGSLGRGKRLLDWLGAAKLTLAAAFLSMNEVTVVQTLGSSKLLAIETRGRNHTHLKCERHLSLCARSS